MEAEELLLKKRLGNIVLNASEFHENTTENAKKWIYVSDIMEEYAQSQLKELREEIEALKTEIRLDNQVIDNLNNRDDSQ